MVRIRAVLFRHAEGLDVGRKCRLPAGNILGVYDGEMFSANGSQLTVCALELRT